MRLVVGSMILIAIMLSGCDSSEPTAVASDNPAIATQALAVIEKPIRIPCNSGDSICAAEVDAQRDDWAKALTGDYGAQRNIAFGFSAGNHVSRNPVQGCAWRMIILAADTASVDQSDPGNYALECGRLSPAQLAKARATAILIAKRVYQRDIVTETGLGVSGQ